MAGWWSKRKRSSKRDLPKTDDPIANPDSNFAPDFLKGRLLDEEENLHFRRIWDRVARTWLFLVNLLLFIAFAVGFLGYTELAKYDLLIGCILATSLAVSPFFAYWQYKRVRSTRLRIRQLTIYYRRKLAGLDEAESGESKGSALRNQKRYRDDVPDLINQFREEANRNRVIHNRFQATIIVGSVGASTITTASVSYSQTRWAAVAITAMVGLAAGFTGYFKYHERGLSSRQTADAIEREYESVELRVGKYANRSEEEAYALFADTVERLRDEQNKRQQQLDQPTEAKREE